MNIQEINRKNTPLLRAMTKKARAERKKYRHEHPDLDLSKYYIYEPEILVITRLKNKGYLSIDNIN